MTLPNFLGIGGQRCGSTWLFELLSSHPQVYLPYIKELHYFNNEINYNRGISWYEKNFPNGDQAVNYRAIGEFTPNYLDCSECPQRIAEIKTISKFLLILRNPVDRAYSHYGLLVKAGKFSGTFENYLQVSSQSDIKINDPIPYGRYNVWLKEYFRVFDPQQFLVLIMEECVANVPNAKNTIAEFLQIDASEFPVEGGTKKVNSSFLPKYRLVSWFNTKLFFALRRLGLYRALEIRQRVDKLMGQGKRSLPPMKEETRANLNALYADDIDELSAMLQMGLSCWK